MAYKFRIAADSSSLWRWRNSFGPIPLALAALFMASAAAIFAVIVPNLYIAAALGGFIVCACAMYLVANTVHGRLDNILLMWLLVSPLGYYFLSFPAEKPIFTFDRFVILLLSGALFFVGESAATPISSEIRRAALVWCGFLLFSFTSIVGLWDEVGLRATRVTIDSFIFPGLLALFVIRIFPAERYVRKIHTLLAITAAYCAAIGLVELLTNTDLLPMPDDTFYGAEQTGTFARVNGPFANNHCFGVIGVVFLMLLLFLRFLMKDRVTPGRIWLHRLGVGSAVVMILLPQFRTLFLALLLIALFELIQNGSGKARFYAGAIIAVAAIGVASLPVLLPNFFESRVADPSNIYGRVAQQQQTWELFSAHPWNGVGFGNFIGASENFNNITFRDVDSLNSAHNSIGSILAETGVAGCLPYVAANVLWFLIFFRLRHSNLPVARAAWKFFLYLFVCYWMMGMTLTSAYEHDLNLWYMFACALMYKLALVERSCPELSELV